MQSMHDILHKIHSLQAGLLCTAWGSSGRPDKASLALMRGLAYAQAGKFEQALRVRRLLLENMSSASYQQLTVSM